jgi:integrase
MLSSTGKSIFEQIDQNLRQHGLRQRMARKGRSKGQGTLYRREGRGPWLASWFDHRGKRREASTRTTDRAAAERILSKHVAEAALRREGIIDPAKDRFATENRKPIGEHVEAYIAHCKCAGQTKRHVGQKAAHLARLVERTGVARLDELHADALESHLSAMREQGLSARSVNYVRAIAVSFFAWCTRTGRSEANPLRAVAKLDESRDRRRVRRPLTADELARLVAVGRERGREAWYLGAALAGLRKGDLQRLTWADVDFQAGTITIRGGKAKRVDTIPMHAQLAECLRARRSESLALPG